MRSACASACLWLALVLAGAAGCATGVYGAGSFRIESNVPEAMVVVDDVLIGKVSDWSREGQHLRPGFHRVEIRYPGYYSHFAEVQLREGDAVVVKAPLRPLLE